MNNIYISFIEEMIMNPKYSEYRTGRIEATHPGDSFHSEEIRFLTKKCKKFEDFRDRWDMKHVSLRILTQIRDRVKKDFMEKV